MLPCVRFQSILEQVDPFVFASLFEGVINATKSEVDKWNKIFPIVYSSSSSASLYIEREYSIERIFFVVLKYAVFFCVQLSCIANTIFLTTAEGGRGVGGGVGLAGSRGAT